jgi:hypothetical protein
MRTPQLRRIVGDGDPFERLADLRAERAELLPVDRSERVRRTSVPTRSN